MPFIPFWDIGIVMELYLLRHLSAFRKCGTLSKTAESLFITQPALSRSMKKLEEEFGVPLFFREKSRISLNRNGVLAADRADAILAMIDGMTNEVRRLDASAHGITAASRSIWAAIELVPYLRRRFPGLTVSTETADRDEDLLTGLAEQAYQLIIIRSVPEGPLYYSQPFSRSRLCACLAPEHPLAGRGSVSAAELNGEDFLVFRRFLGSWGDKLAALLPGSKFLPVEELDDAKALAATSRMSCLSTDLAIRVNGEWKNKVAVPLSDPGASITFSVVCLAAHRQRYAPLFADLGEKFGG